MADRDGDRRRHLREQWETAPIVQIPRIWAVRRTVNGFELGPSDNQLALAAVTVKP